MKKIIDERKDIAFYIKMFPLRNHPAAYVKAKAIVCEKSLTLLEDAYQRKELPKPKCETSVIDQNIKLAEKLGIANLPTMVLPDGRIILGFVDAKTILNRLGN